MVNKNRSNDFLNTLISIAVVYGSNGSFINENSIYRHQKSKFQIVSSIEWSSEITMNIKTSKLITEPIPNCNKPVTAASHR